MARIGHGHALQLLGHIGALAHACGVDQADLADFLRLGIGPLPIDRNGVTRNAGFRAGEQAVLAEDAVDESRLARVRTADDRQLERPAQQCFLILFFRELRLFGLERFQVRQQRFEQVGNAHPVLGGERDRIAEAERIGLQHAAFAGAAFGLVGQHDHRHRRGAQPLADLLVQRRQPGARIDHEKCHIGGFQRRFGLLAHAAGKRFGLVVLPTRRIDDLEFQAEQFGIAEAAVARNARLVVDERELLADEPVEQRGLSDVRSADDDDLG